MKNILDSINKCLEDVNLYSLTTEQRKWINEQYNTYVDFKYGLSNDNDFIFQMRKNTFGNIEYYLGMEYARDDIMLKIQLEDDIIVVYNSSNNRITRIFEYLMPDVFCEGNEEILIADKNISAMIEDFDIVVADDNREIFNRILYRYLNEIDPENDLTIYDAVSSLPRKEQIKLYDELKELVLVY